MSKDKEEGAADSTLSRRRMLLSAGAGAGGLAMAAGGLVVPRTALADDRGSKGNGGGSRRIPGLEPPNADRIARFGEYDGPYNLINEKPFGGFRFAMGYMAEGIDRADPTQGFLNPSGLFESSNPAVNAVNPSGVGGHEVRDRFSVEFWLRDIMKLSNRAIADDLWAFINYMRRMWALDLDDPAADGMVLSNGVRFNYPGSPDPNNEVSLFSPRLAIAPNPNRPGTMGYARMAPTYLAETEGYTVVFRAGREHPNYSGGTTGVTAESPGKVRDGGIWGGVQQDMDVLSVMQAVERGNRSFTVPPGKGRVGSPKWGQFWRRVAAIDNVNINALDPGMPISMRPAPRPRWPVGFLPAGTSIFWGNYNLLFGTQEPRLVLHYQSEIPTRFQDNDGLPKAFLCDLVVNPGGTETPAEQVANGALDPTGEMSGFPDGGNRELDNQNSKGYGRVHGTSYPRGLDKNGRTTYHLRNWLLFPPTLNDAHNINNTVPGKGVLSNLP